MNRATKEQLLPKITSKDVLKGTGDRRLANIFRFHSANRKVFNTLFTISGLATLATVLVVVSGLMPVSKDVPWQVIAPFGMMVLTSGLSWPRIQSDKKLAQIYSHPKIDAILGATEQRILNKTTLGARGIRPYHQ
ncbi:MAG: hypothetical protein CMH32_01980 [Micavibrio sp.]|nr:hypothetical protein [Micavibrio sp.]HCK32892.1 hypothetical protein [Rhodospirillaceae bacterium]|tara:strand:- start:864 stop:1268 length:405 start_codon:yes stop_codon:yes gene_type:complete